MFSQTMEYALRAVIWLVDHGEHPQTAREIAAGMKVPSMYLSKVMQQLVHAGIVTGQRGKLGGFRLARGPREISVLEVINAVDPIKRIKACPLGLERHREHLCPLHFKLDQSLAAMENDFRTTCIADMTDGGFATNPPPLTILEAKAAMVGSAEPNGS
jgi:Rrf2 family transcriptional regulator, nitric oxide-sensitive transcriptional repressor